MNRCGACIQATGVYHRVNFLCSVKEPKIFSGPFDVCPAISSPHYVVLGRQIANGGSGCRRRKRASINAMVVFK